MHNTPKGFVRWRYPTLKLTMSDEVEQPRNLSPIGLLANGNNDVFQRVRGVIAECEISGGGFQNKVPALWWGVLFRRHKPRHASLLTTGAFRPFQKSVTGTY